MTYAMRLNGGDLIRDGEKVKHDGFTVTVMKDGTGFGKAEPLFKTIHTLMTNGSQERISGFGNRAPAIVVKIEGETPDGLNAGGVWLSSLMRPGALEWLPPDQTVWTVFDVVTCYVDRTEDEGWDFQETQWIRKYRIPIKALAHSRSRFRTITPALPLASTPIIDELVTDGSSLTGWSASWKSDYGIDFGGSITPEVVSGAVRVEHPSSQAGALTLLATRTFAAVPSATQFLRVDLRTYGPVDMRWALASNGSTPTMLFPVDTVETDPDGTELTVYYRVPVGTTALTVRAYVTENDDYFAGDTAYLEIDQIRRVSRLPDSGTNRQKVAAISPGGSASAEGSLHVSHPTAGLGKVLVATYPLGRPSPDLTQYRTASEEPVDDTTQVSGERIPLQPSSCVLQVPDTQLPIRGRGALWVKVDVTGGPVTLEYEIIPTTGGISIGQPQTGFVTVGSGAGQLVPLGLVTLPGAETGSGGATVVTLVATPDSEGAAHMDKLWVFGQDVDSALLVVDAGAGTPVSGGASNHLWINAPTAEKPAGEVLIGTSPTDARWPAVIQAGPEVHRFGRDGVGVLTVTCGATDASTDFAHFKRWDHFAAEES